MKNKGATITLDAETFKTAQYIAKRSNKSIAEIIKDLIKKERNKSDLTITKGVKKISGILNTSYDYKELRDMCAAEKARKYENTGRY